MRISRSLLSALCLLSVLCVSAHMPARPGRPKLVVAIVVDQLRTDYIEYLTPLMCSDGFSRMRKEGAYMRDVTFGPSRLDAVSSTALIFTGANPADNGVADDKLWDASALRSLPALNDPATVGVNTSLTLSASPLLLSTVTDELMIDGAGLPLAHAVAADPQMSVIMAGHAGSGAAWLNTADGRWATSSYYKELASPAANRNFRSPLSARIDTMQWKPMLPLDRYPGLPAQKRQYEFRHTFPSRAKDVYERFAASPKGNEEVTDLAIDYLKNLQLGRRGDTVDMLCIGYTAAPFRDVKDGDYRLELQDSYLRLDAQLARLLKAIDSSVGLSNCVIFLSGTGYYDDAVPVDARYRLPSGDFSTKRAMALLNGFFSARYGPGNYVDAFAGGGFHISAKTLEAKGVDPSEAARAAKDFLLKMSGVSAVYTLSDLLSPKDEEARRLRLCTNPRTAPQFTVTLSPGWNLVEDHTYPVVSTPVRRGSILSPAFIMAPGTVNPQELREPVEATALAPTLSSLLHMRAPNGAASRPIPLN